MKRFLNSPLIRYGIMACVVVAIEVGVFVLLNSVLGITYLIATPASMAVGIVLNWIFSRMFVFQESTHKKHVEFILVTIASLIGVGIQLAVTAYVVEILAMAPLRGKLAAIVVTFFWNYLVRRYYIFK